jgi:transitional endoplasmic reticulum ATPase
MNLRLEQLLNKAKLEYKDAERAKVSGDSLKAKEHYLVAAESLIKAAKISQANLKENRMMLAKKLLDEAEEISKQIPSKKSTLASPLPVSDKGDDQVHSWLVDQEISTRFSDIAGLDNVKEQIRLKLLYPFSNPEKASIYGINPGGGILLYGPPGTGKTLIARAVAGEIQAAFFAIKPSEIMNKWVGVAEQNIARLFVEANSQPISVIFIDEIESLAPKREGTNSSVMARVVPQLLAELDGFHTRKNALLFIGASNLPWEMDAAILRPGRLDRLIYVPPPDLQARTRILELNIAPAPLTPDVCLANVAARTENFSGADMASLAQRVRELVFTEAVQAGIIRDIQSSDFDKVLADMHPSIQSDDLHKFELFSKGQPVKRRR